MDYRKFEFADDSFIIELTKEFYTRTASGKSCNSNRIVRIGESTPAPQAVKVGNQNPAK